MLAGNSYPRKLSRLIDLQVALANRTNPPHWTRKPSDENSRLEALQRPLAAAQRVAKRVRGRRRDARTDGDAAGDR